MSANNAIYIAEFVDGFRVALVGAPENLFEFEDEYFLRTVWRESFEHARLFGSLEEAKAYAAELAEDCLFLEYGVSQLAFSVDWRDNEKKE